MRLKIILFASVILFFNEKIEAQMKPETVQTEVTTPQPDSRPRYEIGVNSTAFFKQFLNFSGTKSAVDSNNITETPYFLTAKMRGKRGYWRLGLGASLASKSESSGKLLDTKTTRNGDYQLRIGYEWQRALGNKWTFYYGFDVLGRYKDKALIADSGFDLVNISETTWGTGVAPMAGLRYQIWRNIALSTETAVRYRYSAFQEKTAFSINPDFNQKGKKVDFYDLDFLPPTSIYITLLF
jgi:opacity protein-like surface antigen